MSWQASDFQRLPEVKGQSFTKQEVNLDGKSHQNCTFNECRLVYRGGPARMVSCYISGNCEWKFEDAASYVLQFLQETGWRIIPPGELAPSHNR